MHAKLAIYDVTGRLVATVADGNLEAGTHRLNWDGVDSGGRRIPAGVYFARLEAKDFNATRKILFLRGR